MSRVASVALGSGLLTMALVSVALGQGVVTGRVTRNDRPLSNAVVEFVPASAPAQPVKSSSAVIDQSHLRFIPEVLVVSSGTTVTFLNSDPNVHNVFSPDRGGAGFNLGLYSTDERRSFVFGDPGRYVILCHIHPEMAAWVFVADSPYYGLSNADGEFVIPGVPPGSYRLRSWHHRAGSAEFRLEVSASGVSDLQVRLQLASERRPVGGEE